MSNDKLAQEALDQIMEQAQVFASAWSLVGGPFDSGSALDDANDAKDELRTMVRSLATLAAEAEKQAGPVASQVDLLRSAMAAAGLPTEWRALLIGHFCNVINADTARAKEQP